MLHRPVTALWLALLAMTLAGCVSLSPERGGDTSPGDTRQARAHAHYAQGVLHETAGRAAEALESYHQAALLDPANADLSLDVARQWLLQKQPARALEVLENAAARRDAPAVVYVLIGTSQSALGRINLAVQASRRAVARDPRLPAARQNLHASLLKAGRANEAFQALRAAESVQGADAEFLAGLAGLYLAHAVAVPARKTHCETRALGVLRRADALETDDPLTRLRVAGGFAALGRIEEAAQRYQRLLADHSRTPLLMETIRARLTDLHLRDPDRARAMEQLRRVVRDDPLNQQAHYSLALLATERNDASTAEEHLRAVLMLNPEFEQAHYDLALARLALDRANEALATLDAARGKFGQNFVSEFLLGLTQARLGRFALAVCHFTAAEAVARATDPKRINAQFYYHFGAALERKGDCSGAVEYLEKALAAQPDFPAAANHLGYLWAGRGENLPRARELIERAVRADPRNAAYLDSLAWVLFKLGKPREALPVMLEAVSIAEAEQDFDPVLYDHLGDIHAALGNLDQARAAWRKALEHQTENPAAIRRKLADPE